MNHRVKHGPNVWVVCRHGRFSVREEGATKFVIPPVSQRLAIAIGRILARDNHSELIIQGRRGRIRSRDSHGFDPSPPRG